MIGGFEWLGFDSCDRDGLLTQITERFDGGESGSTKKEHTPNTMLLVYNQGS